MMDGARQNVTQKDDANSRNSCPVCGAGLTGRQKRCSVKCRVALHRRLARQGTTDGVGAVLSVARRVFKKELFRAQIAARKRLRQQHKQERDALHEEYFKRSSVMQDEITASNAAVAHEYDQRMLEQSHHGTLGIAIAQHDRIP